MRASPRCKCIQRMTVADTHTWHAADAYRECAKPRHAANADARSRYIFHIYVSDAPRVRLYHVFIAEMIHVEDTQATYRRKILVPDTPSISTQQTHVADARFTITYADGHGCYDP